VKSNQEAITEYVGKYIAKHIGQREKEDKGVRLVAYSKGAGVNNCKFDWNSPGAKNHRRKLAWLAACLGYTAENYRVAFTRDFGTKWAYVLREPLQRVRFHTYPTLAEAMSDWPEDPFLGVPPGSTDINMGEGSARKARELQAQCLLVAFNERKRLQRAKRVGNASGLGNRKNNSSASHPNAETSIGLGASITEAEELFLNGF
jgi:hypothetical protein